MIAIGNKRSDEVEDVKGLFPNREQALFYQLGMKKRNAREVMMK